jgi:hypothetical protein
MHSPAGIWTHAIRTMYSRTSEHVKAEIFLERGSFYDFWTSIEETAYIGCDDAEMAYSCSSGAQSDSLLSC